MKKSKLLVLSLLAVSAIGLTSCNEGTQGPKGDTGAQGEKGETGNPGKDGKDGIDGKSFLNGEGVPSDSLGNDGDSYVDTKTFDYYTKENGKWVKKGSIKGDQGEQGEKGEKGDTGAKGDAGAKGEKGDTGSTGSTGSQGDKGETAWSNTILPSKNGYVTSSVGSALKDTNVTFTAKPDDGYKLKSLTINGVEKFFGYDYSDTTKLDANGYLKDGYDLSYTVQMPENGCVVQAEFIKKDAEVVGTIQGVSSDTDLSEGETLNEAFKTLLNVDRASFASSHDMKLPGANLTLVDNVRLKANKAAVKDSDNNIHFQLVLNNLGLVTLNLNNKNIDLNQNKDEGDETVYGTEISLQNVELNIREKGKISGNNTLFSVYGGFNYTDRTDNDNKYAGVSGKGTKLTINSNVTTECLKTGETIGVYESSKFCNEEGQSTYKYGEGSPKLTDKIEIQYHGIDRSTSTDGFLYVQGAITGNYEKPYINIGNNSIATSINSFSHISGAAKVDIKNTEFNTRGTAMLVEAGEVNINEKTKFNCDIGINRGDYHKYVQAKTPNYTEVYTEEEDGSKSYDSYTDNGIISVHEDSFDKLGTKVTKVKIANDTTFNTYMSVGYTGWSQEERNKMIEAWQDVSEVCGESSKVEVATGKTIKLNTVKKTDISSNHMEATVNGSSKHVLYFKNGSDAKNYYDNCSTKTIASGENLFANEYGYDSSNTISDVSVTYVNEQGQSVTEPERYD